MTIRRVNTKYGHRYTIDGNKAEGVTTLINGGIPKPQLTNWAARTVAEHVADHLDEIEGMRGLGRDAIVSALKGVPWAQRDEAARRGTEVHALAEKLIHGQSVDVPDEIAGHVDSCVRYLDDWRVRPVLVEAVVGSRQWRYAGTLDSVYDLPDGRRVIGDIKTSRSGLFGEVVLQLAAYRYAEVYLDGDQAEQPMDALGITHAQGIWIRADGYDVYDLPADERAFKDFLHACWVARWAKASRDLIGEPAAPPAVVGAA